MKYYLTALLLTTLSSFGAPSIAEAGRININLTHTTATGTGLDGNGALGAGTWNRINIAQATGPNALVKTDDSATAVTVADAGVPSSRSQTGNLIQDESWYAGPFLTISGLLPDQVYKVVVYGDLVGSGPGTDTYTVNGANKSLPNPGAFAFPLPGVKANHYAEFIVNAMPTGTITITAYAIAGIQIEGLLNDSEKGPQADCRISRAPISRGGMGNGVYAIRTKPSQTLTQNSNGRRARHYYVNIENDGDEIDNFYLMGFWRKKQANVTVIERGSGNVTNTVRRKNQRFNLCKGKTRNITVRIKPRPRSSRDIKVRICGSPSTLIRNRQDCVTCVLKLN